MATNGETGVVLQSGDGSNNRDAGRFDEWRPAIVKPVDESRRQLETVTGKKVLVRPADNPKYPCSCGAPVAEIERSSAESAQPGWGTYGTHRPTICSEMLYVD